MKCFKHDIIFIYGYGDLVSVEPVYLHLWTWNKKYLWFFFVLYNILLDPFIGCNESIFDGLSSFSAPTCYLMATHNTYLYEAVLNRISHGTDSSHVWKIRSDLSRGVKNSTEFFTAAERIPHLSVTNSFGISFIYSTQTYLSPFKKSLKKVPFFTHGFLTNVIVTAYDIKHTINHLIQFRGNIFFFSCISFNRVIDLLFIVLLFLTSNIIGYHKMK